MKNNTKMQETFFLSNSCKPYQQKQLDVVSKLAAKYLGLIYMICFRMFIIDQSRNRLPLNIALGFRPASEPIIVLFKFTGL